MSMSSTFWTILVTMTVVALSFLVIPAILQKRKIAAPMWVFAITIPALAIGLYGLLGLPGASEISPAHQSSAAPATTSTRSQQARGDIGSVESMLSGLEKRLEDEPTDAKGWLLLAKSYSHLGRVDDAAAAYQHARDLGQTDSALEAKLNAPRTAENQSPVVRGRLTIADNAKDRIEPDDSIFIFAKSTSGGAMPLAVLRKTARDLPLDFELSDKQAMSAAAKLSDASMVTITARVSKTGNAMQAEPGLEVVSKPINVGDEALIELQLNPTMTADQN